MFCGTRSFSQIHDEPPSTTSPRGFKLKQSFSMNKKKKPSNGNPYSNTGRDKFEKVLAELDAKKEKIMLRAKSEGDATVRFTYKPDSEDWIPIIIRERETKEEAAMAKAKTKAPKVAKRLSAPPSLEVTKESKLKLKEVGEIKCRKEKSVKRSYIWGVCCWPLVIVLILVLLMYGRSVAICWTTVLWYLMPMMKEWSSEKKPGVVRELGSPRGHICGR